MTASANSSRFVSRAFGVRAVEERRDGEVAEQADLLELVLGLVPHVAQRPVGGLLAGLPDLRAQLGDPLDVPADPDRGEAWSACLPVERLDLAAGEADERVAVAERVVEERERVLAGECHEP